jgi:hypothetical protein
VSGDRRRVGDSGLASAGRKASKQKTEEAISENIYDLRSSEIAILKFLQARLAKKAA